MAKITRKTSKIFAGSAGNNGQFGAAAAGTFLTSNDVEVLQSLAAYGQGWSAATISGEKLPALEEFQTLGYIPTYQVSYVLQEGVPEWDDGTPYFQNSIVKKPGTYQLYGSLTDDNLNNALTDGASWKKLSNLDTPNAVYHGAITTGTANAQISAVTPSDYARAYGNLISFTAGLTCTGPMTLNFGGTGAVAVKKGGNSGIIDTAANDVYTGESYTVFDNGTYYELLDPSLPVFGTAATYNVGTSGATIPLLNGVNTWSNPQTFSSTINKITFNAPTTSASMSFPVDGAGITFQGTDTYVGRNTSDNLKNKTLNTGSVSFNDNADITKQLSINLTGSGTGINTTLLTSSSVARSITLPNATTTLVGRDTTDTLTNKIINAVASTVSAASLNIAPGVAPTAPANGDVWVTGSHIFARINGVTYQLDQQSAGIPYAAIAGLLPSSIAGTSTTAALNVSAGQATDSTNVAMIAGAGYSWAVTNGNAINGYQGGTTLPNSATIHFFLCQGTSGIGVFASTSLTPTLPTGYTSLFRRIFSLRTNGSGALLPMNFVETEGGSVIAYYVTQISDVNTTLPSLNRTLFSLTVPNGIKVGVLYRTNTPNANGQVTILTSADETDVAPTSYASGTAPLYDAVFSTVNGVQNTAPRDGMLTTNTSGQIGARSDFNTQAFALATRGFKDFRRS